nr:transmembrane protease serine 9-like [Penaeus vannamei]
MGLVDARVRQSVAWLVGAQAERGVGTHEGTAPRGVNTATCNKATSVDIIYGTININGIGGTRVTASRFIDHPGYDSSTNANDIALVELPQPLNYATDAKIQPICLGLEEDIPFGGKAVASGWGDLSFGLVSKDERGHHLTSCRK